MSMCMSVLYRCRYSRTRAKFVKNWQELSKPLPMFPILVQRWPVRRSRTSAVERMTARAAPPRGCSEPDFWPGVGIACLLQANFGGLVLGCINADFCVQILILQRFSRSTPPLEAQNLRKFCQTFSYFCWNFSKSRDFSAISSNFAPSSMKNFQNFDE